MQDNEREKLQNISHRIMRSEFADLTNQELQFYIQRTADNKTANKKARLEYETRLKHAGIIEQEKANKLSENNIKINKWGLIISAILAFIAIIISVFAYLKP